MLKRAGSRFFLAMGLALITFVMPFTQAVFAESVEIIEKAKEKAEDMAESAKETAEEAVEKVKDAAEEKTEEGFEAAEDLVDQGKETAVDIVEEPFGIASRIRGVKNILEDDNWHDRERGLSPHKPNYFLPFSYSGNAEDRKSLEFKFQISFKQSLGEVKDHLVYFGYSQKSFWQAYDTADSKPFRETNYNPEIFIRSDTIETRDFGEIGIDVGYEHESNGRGLTMSRSWDRLYVTFRNQNDFLSWDAKLWYRIPESKKSDPMDPAGDENEDILDYMGFGELSAKVDYERFLIHMKGRLAPNTGNGFLQADVTWPAEIFDSTYWFVQALTGYGESLIDYNRHLSVIGFGLMFSR